MIQIGTLVKGLLTKQAAIANGTFAFARIAMSAESSACGIIGIIEKNRPIASPLATVSRQGIHRVRAKSGLVSDLHHER